MLSESPTWHLIDFFFKFYGKTGIEAGNMLGTCKAPLFSCLPSQISCLGGRICLEDLKTKYKLSAITEEEGFEEETINQVFVLF